MCVEGRKSHRASAHTLCTREPLLPAKTFKEMVMGSTQHAMEQKQALTTIRCKASLLAQHLTSQE